MSNVRFESNGMESFGQSPPHASTIFSLEPKVISLIHMNNINRARLCIALMLSAHPSHGKENQERLFLVFGRGLLLTVENGNQQSSGTGVYGEDLLLFLTLRNGSLLVLLVFGYQVVHVALSLCKLHLIHTLPRVPMQESLTTEHSGELITNTLEQLLN